MKTKTVFIVSLIDQGKETYITKDCFGLVKETKKIPYKTKGDFIEINKNKDGLVLLSGFETAEEAEDWLSKNKKDDQKSAIYAVNVQYLENYQKGEIEGDEYENIPEGSAVILNEVFDKIWRKNYIEYITNCGKNLESEEYKNILKFASGEVKFDLLHEDGNKIDYEKSSNMLNKKIANEIKKKLGMDSDDLGISRFEINTGDKKIFHKIIDSVANFIQESKNKDTEKNIVDTSKIISDIIINHNV